MKYRHLEALVMHVACVGVMLFAMSIAIGVIH